jgi:hypothetical protein
LGALSLVEKTKAVYTFPSHWIQALRSRVER